MPQKITALISVLRSLRELTGHDRWTRDTLVRYQEKSLNDLRSFAYANSPFYREFHSGLENAPLAELPILTKHQVMDNFNDFVTDRELKLENAMAHLAAGNRGRLLERYEIVTTSGSTGTPGIFAYDKREWSTIIASFARAREWAGLKVNLAKRSKMAVVSSTKETNISARVGKFADTPFIPTLRLDATESLAIIVAKLNEWQPEALVGYASMVYGLAQEQIAGRLHIEPSFIFTSSETFTDAMLQTVESVWCCRTFNEYAATETATIAAEDTAHHGMHVFGDLLIVENVDSDGNPVAAGEFGERLLVTTLFSRTQPLIRYEISDSVRFSNKPADCSMPYQTIDRIQGRREDVIFLTDPDGKPVAIHPNVFHDAMDTLAVAKWQIIQTENGLRVIVVKRTEDLNASRARDAIKTSLAKQNILNPEITVEVAEFIPKTASGKQPLIKSLRREPV